MEEIQNRENEIKKAAAGPDIAYNAVSVCGDTVSISEAGKAAGAKRSLSQSKSSDGTVVLRQAEEEEIVSTINLSQYTKVELQELYLNGGYYQARV